MLTDEAAGLVSPAGAEAYGTPHMNVDRTIVNNGDSRRAGGTIAETRRLSES